METNEDLSKYKAAYRDGFKYKDENHAMLEWYASRLIQKALAFNRIDILSLGIGYKIVNQSIIQKLARRLGLYVIVEGSQAIIDEYLTVCKPNENVKLIHSYFEEFETSQLFDIIEMGFVLEHVDDPQYILKHYRRLLKNNGIVFVAVPNARSLHRLIGQKAGLLKDLYQLSEYDLQLGHKRYFDLEGIKNMIESAGLEIISTEGVFLKPVTTDQMRKLNLADNIMQALFQIGREYPEISYAILVEARK